MIYPIPWRLRLYFLNQCYNSLNTTKVTRKSINLLETLLLSSALEIWKISSKEYIYIYVCIFCSTFSSRHITSNFSLLRFWSTSKFCTRECRRQITIEAKFKQETQAKTLKEREMQEWLWIPGNGGYSVWTYLRAKLRALLYTYTRILSHGGINNAVNTWRECSVY